MKEKWVADFSKPERSCFDIKPEISYNAKLEKRSLFLGLKKKNCMAWLETANRVYVDQLIEARLRFDCSGGYCATGILFRVMENGTYYLALVSSKGYFRLDAVNNHVPQALIGWTEMPSADGDGAVPGTTTLGIVAKGRHLIFTIGGKWIAELDDSSIPGGHLGFALVSYGSDTDDSKITDGYVCRAWLDHLSVDSRPKIVEEEYRKWSESEQISTESRFCLAETFVALDQFESAYSQVQKAWKQRENAARSVGATITDIRTGNELLFAARLASQLGRHETAERHINACLSVETKTMTDSADEREVFAERAKILSALGKFDELVGFLPDYIRGLETGNFAMPSIPPLYALLGHAWWNLKNYEAAADAWAKAFDHNKSNGLYAENAADAYEVLGKEDEAMRYLLKGGNCFLQQANFEKLGAMVPKLLAAGQDNKEARELAEKWAEGTGACLPDLVPEHATPIQDESPADSAEGPCGDESPRPDFEHVEAEAATDEQAVPPNKAAARKPPRAKKAAVNNGGAEPVKKPKAKTEKKPAAVAKARAAKAKAAKVPEKPATKAKAKPGKAGKSPGEPAETGSGKTARKPAAKAPAKAKPDKVLGEPAGAEPGKTARKPAAKAGAKQTGSTKSPAAKPKAKASEKPAPKARKAPK